MRCGWPLNASVSGCRMRTFQTIAVLLALVAAFIGGYALCEWRDQSKVFPALEDSARLHHAVLSARIAAQIDRGEVSKARAKLLVIARVNSDPIPDFPMPLNWLGILVSPFGNDDLMISMLHRSDEPARNELVQLMIELVRNSPRRHC